MKKNRVKISLIGVCLVIIVLVFAKNVTQRMNDTSEPMYDSSVKRFTDTTVSRAYAAKMISLLQYSKEDLESLEEEISYEDVAETTWYHDYVNALQTMEVANIFSEGEPYFEPDRMVTYQDGKKLVLALDSGITQEEAKQALPFLYDEKKAKDTMTFEDFIVAYNYLLSNVFSKVDETPTLVEPKELYVLGTSKNLEELGAFKILTDEGEYSSDGISMDDYIDHTINTYVKGKEILYVTSIDEKEKVLSNVLILSKTEKALEVYINGVKRTIEMNNPISEDINNMVADVVVKNQRVKTITIKPDKIRGKVLVAKEDYIELEGYGKLPLDSDYRVYKVYDQINMEMTNGILVGYENTDFVVSDGKICAALITEKIKAQNIRVLLRDSSYKSLFHKVATVTADREFYVTYGETKKTYAAGEEVTIKSGSGMLKSGRVTVTTSGEDGKITILSLDRKGIHPSYRGKIEVASTEDGLTVINELSLEEYLYAVLPSEMPTSYGLEALKVQAVCARSYAYNHLIENSLSKYGAHVDDSTTYQVYNNSPETQESMEAVKETYGQVLQYDGQVIFAYYFSTSCGYTADVSNVWLNTNDSPYLQAVFQGNDQQSKRDFSDEKKFYQFITSNKEDTYEKDYPWYRWTITIDYSDLKKMVDSRLGALYKKKPAYVLTLAKDGTYKKKAITTVGTIKNIKVSKRESSGLATEIIIEGSKNTVKIKSESYIRQILRPSYDAVIRQDGSEISNLSLLPSAFFVLDKVKEGSSVKGIKISGGGYGHGVGMSQNGVKSLVDEGKAYEEVLKHYYKDIDISYIY